MLRLLLATCCSLLATIALAQNKNVGIGTTTPQAQLHTTGSVRFDTLAGIGSRPVYVDASGQLNVGTPPNTNIASVPIPDGGCNAGNGISRSITVTGQPTSVASANIRVRVDITHTYNADVQVLLTSPTGAILRLIGENGFDSDNFTNTVFGDAATQSLPTDIGVTGAPFTGFYKPTGGLAALCTITPTLSTFGAMGGGTINPNGTWTLSLFDTYTGDVGRLNSWGISFNNSNPLTPAGSFVENALVKSNGANLLSTNLYETGGSIGVGTATPAANLDVVGSTLGLRNASGWDNLWFNVDGNRANINASGAGAGLSFKVGNNGGGTYGDGQTLTTAMTLLPNGNIGIGNTTPHAPLHFSNAVGNRKLVLYEAVNNDHQYYGLGINADVLRYQVPLSTTDHVFYAGQSTTTSRELMRITGEGHVGIGTATPFSQLSNTAGNIIGSDANGGNPGSFAWAANQQGYAAQIYNVGTTNSANGLAVKVADPNAMVLDVSQGAQNVPGLPLFNVRANGRVGIGTANPALNVDVIGGTSKQIMRLAGGRGQSDNDGILIIQDSSNNNAGGANNELLMFLNAGANIIGTISRNSGTNSIAFNTTSDARLKTGIRPTRYGLRDLMNIQVTDYHYKGISNAAPQTGFLAQQLYSVYPEAVTKGNDADEAQPYMVDYSKLTPLLVKSVQELKAENDALKAEVAEMKVMLKALLKKGQR